MPKKPTKDENQHGMSNLALSAQGKATLDTHKEWVSRNKKGEACITFPPGHFKDKLDKSPIHATGYLRLIREGDAKHTGKSGNSGLSYTVEALGHDLCRIHFRFMPPNTNVKFPVRFFDSGPLTIEKAQSLIDRAVKKFDRGQEIQFDEDGKSLQPYHDLIKLLCDQTKERDPEAHTPRRRPGRPPQDSGLSR